MRFLVDENLPQEAAQLLRQAGHDAVTIRERRLTGAPDTEVAEVARSEECTLITLDVDFGNTQAYPPEAYAGIVVLRLERQDKEHVLAAVAALIPKLAEETLVGNLWIVDEDRIRIRGGK